MISDTWNKKNLGKFIKALESGRYPQTNGTLCDVNDYGKVKGYCCLGVASKISRVGKFGSYGAFTDNKASAHDQSGSVLTFAVQNWLGVDQPDPYIYFPNEYTWYGLETRDRSTAYALPTSVSCTILNDSYGLTFKQIADMLRYFIYNNLPDTEDVSAK